MAEPSTDELQALLQAYLNCLELCRAFHKQTGDPYVRRALGSLVHDLQECLASLAGRLRQWGVAPGLHELDRQGKARIQEVLAMRSLHEQLLVVRRSLAELTAWYAAHRLVPQESDQAPPDWLAALSAQTYRMLEGWDRHMVEMKAARF